MVFLIVKLGSGTSTRLPNGHFSTQWFMNRAAPNRVQFGIPPKKHLKKTFIGWMLKTRYSLSNCLAQTITEGIQDN